LVVGITLPPLYLFVMIQYGAITFPYWDHVPTAKYIIQYFDGTLTFKDLVEPHNEARPLLPRLIFVASAALTKWDVRAEYSYIYLTVYGALATLLIALWRLSRDWPKPAMFITALLISILACSPVGAMNHYWSLMLYATLCYLFAIVALLVFSMSPLSWPANITAAILAWMAAYSVGQGLFLFPVIALVHQLIAPRPLVLTRWSIFWLTNMVVCYALYIPGTFIGQGVAPAMSNFLAFIPIYVGNPFGSLLWFPEMGVVWLRETSIINAICGVILLGLSCFTAWRALPELVTRRTEALIFFSFALYAGACTVTTAWGRANGPYAIATANSSRYSVWPACLLFALIFYYAPKFARRELAFTTWHKAVLGIFLIASAVSYVRAVPVYASAHDDNTWLANAYTRHAEPSYLDIRVFPSADFFRPKKADLLRLGIGPYRFLPETVVPNYDGAFVAAVPLVPGTIVKQRFRLEHPLVRSISFPVVTWARRPSFYRVHWTAVGLKNGSTLGEGSFSTSRLADWQVVTARLNGAVEEPEVDVTFSVEGSDAVQNPIGLALYASSTDRFSAAVINGKAREDGSKVGMTVHYDQ
jgi:hypothetical protein